MNIIRRLIVIIKRLYRRFGEDEISALGAQMAYYFVFSLFPFLIFLMTLIGYSTVSKNAVFDMLSLILPESAFDIVKSNIMAIIGARNLKLMSIGFVIMLWAASNGVGALIRGLNKAYDEEEGRSFWVVRGEAIAFTVVLAFIILLSFILLVFGGHIGNYIVNLLGLGRHFYATWDILRYSFMLLMMTITFALLYYHGPNRKLLWKEVIPGAIFATVGWIAASIGFAYYVNNFSDYSKTYGTIGGVIVLLVWLFISAIIILVGGELNAVITFEREGKDKPKRKRY